jgi:hypothetical protein
MRKVPVLLLIAFFFVTSQGLCQILPKEGGKYNGRLMGFSFPAVAGSDNYKVEIAAGYYNNADSFRKKVIRTVVSKSNKIIGEVPAFGSQYTWRVSSNGKNKSDGTLYHFSTQTNIQVDTNKLRLRILQPAVQQYKDYYVAVDGGGVLYDMKGRPVWFIPDTNRFGGNVADMKFTSQGTITFINRNPYEINYNGDVLWQVPDKTKKNDSPAQRILFHHEFTKLSNGHYMIMGMQLLGCKVVRSNGSSYIVVTGESDEAERNGYKPGRFGCLIEYDAAGNIVWSWQSSKYLSESDFAYFNPPDSNQKFDAHDNAFFFDEKNSAIYVGFRNINRIIKIEYPSGKVLNVYGEKYGPREKGATLFCGQHSIGRTLDGYLYVFNNNSCQLRDSLPTVVIMQEPFSAKDTLKKIWEYTCTTDGDRHRYFGSGGNAVELPDRSMFINTGSDYSKLLIVSREKKILWSALPEHFLESYKKWMPNHEYRANIISREELERLVWSSEKSKSR